jgi:hypothetical protein
MDPKVFSYDLSKGRIMYITYEDFLFKWEVDIVEDKEAHWKAEDQRRSMAYRYHFQSIEQLLADPWDKDILEADLEEIKRFIQDNLTEEDVRISNEKIKGITYSVWEKVK